MHYLVLQAGADSPSAATLATFGLFFASVGLMAIGWPRSGVAAIVGAAFLMAFVH